MRSWYGARAAGVGIAHAARRRVVGVVRVVHEGEPVVGPGGDVPVLDGARLVVADAIGRAPLVGEDQRAGRRGCRSASPATRARSNAGRLALVHAAGDLADAVAAVEADDGARRAADLIGGRSRARRTGCQPDSCIAIALAAARRGRCAATSCIGSGLPQPWPMSATARPLRAPRARARPRRAGRSAATSAVDGLVARRRFDAAVVAVARRRQRVARAECAGAVDGASSGDDERDTDARLTASPDA